MRRPALSSLALAAFVSASLGSPAAAQSCQGLAAELAALDRGGGGTFAAAAARQRAELGRAESLAGRCAAVPSAACSELPRRLREMRLNLARLEASARRGTAGASAARRARVAGAMQRSGCGRTTTAAAVPAPPRGGLLAFLGFAPAPAVAAAPPIMPQIIMRGPPPALPREGPAERALRQRVEAADHTPATGFGRGPYRTLCVRSCDGYFWPVSYSVPQAAFERDEMICRSACPNIEVALYVHRNPGGARSEAISLFGQPYSQHPNAFRFRDRFEPACQCRPAGPERVEEVRGGFTPLPAQGQAPPPRHSVVPIVISTGRHDTSDRTAGQEGLRGVHPGRAGPATTGPSEAAPAPPADRSEAEAP